MKTNKLFTLAALTCGLAMSFASCSNDDNPAGGKTTAVISFENQALNADGFWIGEAKGNSFSYSDDWGGKTTTYTDNVYTEDIVQFPVTYSIYESQYGPSDFWSGVAISSRTETTFNALTMTPDQYNNIVGKAHTGSQFAVIQTYGEEIDLAGATVKGFWYTNSAYAVNSMVNGDSYVKKFTADDFLKCTVTGKKADGTTATVDIDLAKNGDYVKEWKYADLSSLGSITSLSFAFTSSQNNQYGNLVPAYICIDDIEVEY